MAVRAGEIWRLSSLLPQASPSLHVVELGYDAHFPHSMELVQRHGERLVGDGPQHGDRGGCQANASVGSVTTCAFAAAQGYPRARLNQV